MPSVRVRRNTATAALPTERVRKESTSSRGGSGENAASTQDQALDTGMEDKERGLEEGVVVLAPPVPVSATSAEMKGKSI
jgi:hypothetical protein